MFEHSIIQGRTTGPAELAQVRELLAGHPDWSRRRISEHLARLWDWRNLAGQLKDMAARTLLLKLEQRGLIQLPARRRVPSNRMRTKQITAPLQIEPSQTIARSSKSKSKSRNAHTRASISPLWFS